MKPLEFHEACSGEAVVEELVDEIVVLPVREAHIRWISAGPIESVSVPIDHTIIIYVGINREQQHFPESIVNEII